MLGRTEQAMVVLEVEEPAGTEEQPVRLVVNVGSFGPVERIGPGRHRVRYTPPATRHPQVALVGWWRRSPGALPEILRLPLLGTTRLRVEAPAGRAVRVDVGSVRFGPVKAGRKGTAVVPLVVPPGIDRVTVSITGGRETVTREVALEMPQASVGLVVPSMSAEPTATPTATDRPSGPSALSVAPPEEARSRRAPTATATPTVSVIRIARRDPDPLTPALSPRGGEGGRGGPPASVYLGVRTGYTHSLGELAGGRFGIDSWIPVQLGPARMGVGFSASYGQAAQAVADGAGTLQSRSEARFVPVTARVGYELWTGRVLSATAGFGVTAAIARFTNTLGPSGTGTGLGALGFGSFGWALGPGQLFAEASLGRAPVTATGFRLEAGGLSLDVGYRVRID
ncbi:MAG TPA: hypothetical protein VEM76_10050 [Anaeromyxobacteraceae bacterium]|nr:hypothetical protein [Anaeromyxobacteraceae bacterium]